MDPIKNPSATDQALLALMDNMKQGKDFVLEQAPDVIQQLILYRTIREVAFLAVGLGLLAFAIVLLRCGYKWEKEAKNTYDDGWIGMIIGGVLLGILGFCVTFDASLCLLKLIIAPKVWLMEYAARLM